MPIVIAWNTVFVRIDAIEGKVPGGMAQFQSAVPTRMACRDADLVGVYLMAREDVEAYLVHLQALGLAVDGQTRDVAVVHCLTGPYQAVDWLEFADAPLQEQDLRVRVARWQGSTEDQVVFPEGWRPEHSALTPGGAAGWSRDREDLQYLRHQDGVDVYWHKDLKKEVYVARTYPQAEGERPASDVTTASRRRAERDQLFHDAWKRMQDSGAARLVPPQLLGWWAARKARSAIALFDRCLAQAPEDSAAHFWKGKCLQSLGRVHESLDSYQQAWLLNPTDADIAREAGISAIEAERVDLGVYFAQEALRLRPDGLGLQDNLALAQMFAGNMTAALSAAESAVKVEPDNDTTRMLHRVVRAVVDGRMPRPSRVRDIDWSAV